MKIKKALPIIIFVGLLCFADRPAFGFRATAHIRDIIFPVLGATSFSDDFGDPRSGGRTHEGNDIFGAKMQPLVAAADGLVWYVIYPEASWGYSVAIRDEDGYQYRYLHVNNDTPGTDDGRGTPMVAYAPGMVAGAPVVKGQLLGWLGDSGNAEGTSPHLHFEIRGPDGEPINPYRSLRQARRIAKPRRAPVLPAEILPFGEFKGGSSVAIGELDPQSPGLELVVAAGPGGGPLVRIYNANGLPLAQFYAYDKSFRGGVDIATGDTTGDGIEEIITAPGSGSPPEIRVINVYGQLQSIFLAYAKTFTRGVRVAAADLDADGIAEIITGPQAGGGPHVRVFNPRGERQAQFFAYSEKFRGGIDVAAYPATPETPSLIVTTAGPGGGPHVRLFDRAGTRIGQFFSDEENWRGGLRLDLTDVDPATVAPEIVTVPASNGSPIAHVFDLNGTELTAYRSFERWWTGGYDVAASQDQLYIATSRGRTHSRRASVRPLLQDQTDHDLFDFFRQR